LRHFGDVLLTLVPLIVAGAVTLELMVLLGEPDRPGERIGSAERVASRHKRSVCPPHEAPDGATPITDRPRSRQARSCRATPPAAEEAKGLLDEGNRIGTRNQWERILAENGLALRGHRLIRHW